MAEAVCRLLDISLNPAGADMRPQDSTTFNSVARRIFRELSRSNGLEALEFATAISAFLHECRHVHDMRLTRCGAELLLHDLQVYAGVSAVIEELSRWQGVAVGRAVPLPIVHELDRLEGLSESSRQRLRMAQATRSQVAHWWKTRSRGPMSPGLSIHTLFETLGFSVQLEWLANTLGEEVAKRVVDGMSRDVAIRYMEPSNVLAGLMAARGVTPEFEPHDLSWLLVHALSVVGVAESFNNQVPTERHPGTWFGEFAESYATLLGRKDLDRASIAPFAVERTTEAAGLGGDEERYHAADRAIKELQSHTLRGFAGDDDLDTLRHNSESLLVATEVASDFGDMQRAVAKRPRDYHSPLGYVDLLLGGDLTRVHVRVHGRDGSVGDFRTPSWIPSTHVGGARVASEASQQMRILLSGRSAWSSFYESAVFRELKGPPRNLKFRVVN